MKKPITPYRHGIIDYALIAALLILPGFLKMNRKAVNINTALGVNLGLYNSITDHGTSIKPIIPFEKHYEIDKLNVAALTLLTLNKNIRKDKIALTFHTVFLSIAILNVLLTDPEKI